MHNTCAKTATTSVLLDLTVCIYMYIHKEISLFLTIIQQHAQQHSIRYSLKNSVQITGCLRRGSIHVSILFIYCVRCDRLNTCPQHLLARHADGRFQQFLCDHVKKIFKSTTNVNRIFFKEGKKLLQAFSTHTSIYVCRSWAFFKPASCFLHSVFFFFFFFESL